MESSLSSLGLATTCLRMFVLIALVGTTNATATMQELPPIKVHIFGVQTKAPVGADTSVADSVADFQKAVTEKLAKTMRLVQTRAEADIALEVLERDRQLMNREVQLRVHDRGGEPTTLSRSSQAGGFAYIAEGTMNLLSEWAQQYYKAVVGLEPADALRQMPPDLYFDRRELRIPDAAIRANAAVRIGLRGGRARAAAPALVELLGNGQTVTSDRIVTATGVQRTKNTSLPVGVVAGRALASIGAVEDLYTALSSDVRERARVNAAQALSAVAGVRTIAALQAALTTDTSTKVRKAAAQSLEAIGKKP